MKHGRYMTARVFEKSAATVEQCGDGGCDKQSSSSFCGVSVSGSAAVSEGSDEEGSSAFVETEKQRMPDVLLCAVGLCIAPVVKSSS